MSLKYKVLIAVLALTVSFAAGRHSAPSSIKTDEKTSEVEKKTEDKVSDIDKNRHKKTVVTEVTMPDGTKKKTTTTTDDVSVGNHTSDSTTSDSTKTAEKSTEIIINQDNLTVSLLTGVRVNSLTENPMVYGASVSKNLIGPISLGVWGLTDKTAGVSIGLSF